MKMTFWDDERSLRLRLAKLFEFLEPPGLEGIRLFPRPWSDPARPYFYMKPLRNPDGYGGYTGVNSFDEDGVPYQPGPAGRLYHPLIVANYGMKMLAIAAQEDDPEAAARARRVLPALVESGRRTAAWARGPASDAMSSDRPYAPVQGIVISALLRLCNGRPDNETADLIDRAIRITIAPVERGGTLSILDGGPFLEEAPGSPLRHILGGCLNGLFGLYDAADVLDHAEASRTALAVERGLAGSIGRFVAPLGWSFYALSAYGRPYWASMHYHRFIILKARIVAIRSGERSVALAAKTWEEAIRSSTRRILSAGIKTAQTIWMRDVRGLRLDLCP